VWRVVWEVGLLVVVRVEVVVGMMAQWRRFGEVLVLAVDCPERSPDRRHKRALLSDLLVSIC
jgi:hypothetical protein